MHKREILVAASLTHGRDAAFDRGLAIAQRSGRALYVVHAVPTTQPFSFGAAERLRRTDQFLDRAERMGVPMHAVEQHGDPAAIIELHANARAADLIVMGADRPEGPTWLRRSTLTERILRRCSTPTLVVPGHDDARHDFNNVVAAVDLSPESNTVIEHAIRLTSADSPRLTIVHAVEGIESSEAVQNPARWLVPEYRTYLVDDARRQLGTVLKAVARPADTRVRLVTGSAPDAIVSKARAIEADLIVVGRSDRFRALGRTAVRVLRDDERALLVVPTAERRGRRLAA